MKVIVEIDFFDYFPPPQAKQFLECLKEVQEKKLRYGSIELHIAEYKIQKIILKKYFENKEV